MRIRWRGLELPTQVICDEESSTDYYGKFSIEPFERGFGTTIGNSLRRILLSSLEGAAVTRVKIERAAHEFTSLPGVLEDVTDIVLNIKGLAIRMDADEPRTIRVTRTAKGNVTAAAIETDPKIEIINHDHHLATLTDKVELSIEMVVEKGRGWRPAEDNLGTEADVNVFPIDSSFSPVTRVRYKAVDTRVGQRTNYDCLIMEIWTNGAIKPEDALVEAAKILRKHLNPFVLYHDAGTDEIIEAKPEEPFTVNATRVLPFKQIHGRIHSLGFRIGDFAYSTDLNTLPDKAFEILQGVDVWVVDAQCYEPVYTLSHVKQTLEWMERVKPRLAVLTHMNHRLDYDTLASELPDGVVPAFDNMVIDNL